MTNKASTDKLSILNPINKYLPYLMLVILFFLSMIVAYLNSHLTVLAAGLLISFLVFFYLKSMQHMTTTVRNIREKHRHLYETIDQGVIYQAADSKITSANPAAEKILGLTFDQMQGKTSLDPRWQMKVGPDPAQGTLLAEEGFAAYFAVPLIAKGTVKGVLEVYHREPVEANSNWLSYLEILVGQTAIAVDNAELLSRLESSSVDLLQAYDATIEGWAHALDLKDEETEEHSQRVTEMTVAMARKMNIKDMNLVHVRRGALLHDIGKMGIPDSILQELVSDYNIISLPA